MIVSSPSAHYYFNVANSSTNHSWSYDEMVNFDVDATATVMFIANGQDQIQWMGVDAGGAPIAVAGITSPAQPYDGQFARLDVTSAVAF
jgi:hypothetical protein